MFLKTLKRITKFISVLKDGVFFRMGIKRDFNILLKKLDLISMHETEAKRIFNLTETQRKELEVKMHE